MNPAIQMNLMTLANPIIHDSNNSMNLVAIVILLNLMPLTILWVHALTILWVHASKESVESK